MKLLIISDTHGKHKQLTERIKSISEVDVLIHAGDVSSRGYEYEIQTFLDWISEFHHIPTKIFIAGNHDFFFEQYKSRKEEMLSNYKDITYLQDDPYLLEGRVTVWGSPWQPKFYSWAFNLERNSQEMIDKWNEIPTDTDILITHGPPFGTLDLSSYGNVRAGSEVLQKRVDLIKPKIHIFGHIHNEYGYVFKNGTHYINASSLDGRYDVTNDPVYIEWEPTENTVEFLNK